MQGKLVGFSEKVMFVEDFEGSFKGIRMRIEAAISLYRMMN